MERESAVLVWRNTELIVQQSKKQFQNKISQGLTQSRCLSSAEAPA